MRTISNILFLILLFLRCADVWSFTVVLKDGRRVEGTWIAENQLTIQIKDEKGVIRTYQKSELDMKTMATSSRLSVRDAKRSVEVSPTKLQTKETRQSTQETGGLSASVPPSEKPDGERKPAVSGTPDRATTPTTGMIESPQIGTPTIPKISSKRWSLEAGLSNVYESNIHHDEEDIVESVGVVSSLSTRFRNRASNPNFLFRYEIGLHEYTNTDAWDRVSHNMRAAHLISLGKFLLENNLEIALNGSSEDRERGDSYGFRPVLNYYITNSMQLELFAAYRHRKFDTGTDAINRYAGFGFVKEWKDHEIEGYYRYEYNDSENFRNDRYVSTYSLGHTMPVFGDVTASFAARLRATRYLSRLVEIEVEDGPDIEFLRRDKKWNFKFALGIPLGKKFELVPEYEYEIRTSNDPEKKYNAHGALLSVVYTLW